MIRKVFFSSCAFCCGVVLLLSGCLGGSTEPTRYYVLSEIEPSAEVGSADLFAAEEGLLLVGPVTGPRHQRAARLCAPLQIVAGFYISK